MPTILCVDDSPKTLRLLSALLQFCGYRVLTARDPDTALRVARFNSFDLAILDYQVPYRSGLFLAKAIKGFKANVPIMLFSGTIPLASDELKDVDEFVAKGEGVELMLHKVRRLLEHAGALAPRDMASEDGCGEELEFDEGESSLMADDVEAPSVRRRQNLA